VPRTRKPEGEDLKFSQDAEKRQHSSMELNEEEARAMFKSLPWAKVLIDPRFYWFRQ